MSDEWREDCLRWHGRVLVGLNAHWCDSEWDGLPIDETSMEFMVCKCEWSNAALQARAEGIRELIWEVFNARAACRRMDMAAWKRANDDVRA